MIPYAIAFILLFGVCDRFAGGPFVKEMRLPGRPVWYATVFMAIWLVALDVLAHGRPIGWGWVALAWFVWREPAWKLFGGNLTPETIGQAAGFTLRHLLFLGVAGVAYWLGRDWRLAGVTVLVWAFLATLLGVWLWAERDDDTPSDVNGIVETVRGLLQGVAVALILTCPDWA